MQFFSDFFRELADLQEFLSKNPFGSFIWNVCFIVYILSLVIQIIQMILMKTFVIDSDDADVFPKLWGSFYLLFAIVTSLCGYSKVACFFLTWIPLLILEFATLCFVYLLILIFTSCSSLKEWIKSKKAPKIRNNTKRSHKEEEAQTKNPFPDHDTVNEEQKSEKIYQQAKSEIDFFANCDSVESLKRRHRDLAKTYHPDNGNGDPDIIQIINAQYDERIKQYQ